MNEPIASIKIEFVEGLLGVVLKELEEFRHIRIASKANNYIYLDNMEDFEPLHKLRSVARTYLVTRDKRYNPRFVSRHKSTAGNLISQVITGRKKMFSSFRILCAGHDSPEVREIADYIDSTYGLHESPDADLKLHIIHTENTWEVGVQTTPRPLSVRSYKVKNMVGAMDPTLAYAVNSLCGLKFGASYLNIFSGSATLLIEAGLSYPNLGKMVGLDNDKKTITLAIQNIKKAGLIKRIKLKEGNIFDQPPLGKFDTITADLPFGMLVSKNENLQNLYRTFVEYCEGALRADGTLVAYTNRHELFKKAMSNSKLTIIDELRVKLVSSVKAFIYPTIFVCKYKKNEPVSPL